MSKDFPFYTTEYISGVMSLRKPQARSLSILEDVLRAVPLEKGGDLSAALARVRDLYPTCTDFERSFVSLTFALATGVGKTRLMGAFIAYLYTQMGVKNFFVVAPNTTIYEKLKSDLSDSGSLKYVFSGLGCFASPPEIITDDDYREKSLSLFASDVHIFIYNIDKFNKDGAKMKQVNERIGDSFYQYLSSLSDLVLIMDESHHYRAERGAEALNELHPVLGLELTATPLVSKGSKQVPFKNVVYEYPLSRAIEDGYTRTPFALTRSDVDFYQFGDEALDKLMLTDGIANHEHVKGKLLVYAANHGKRPVKPFMLVVCRDTDHAAWVESYIKSDDFRGGAYRGKTITVHSKQKGAESEANTRLLLDVENPENPVEIVIHVNMLKEGWDVNNLYTIVPLRTAASKILREQMVGRGLRLPYGARTGDRDVDAVMLTAHDKFKELLEEAQKGDSIFHAGNVILAEEIEPEQVVQVQPTLLRTTDADVEKGYEKTKLYRSEENDTLLHIVCDAANEELAEYQKSHPTKSMDNADKYKRKENVLKRVEKKVSDNPDLAKTFQKNQNPLSDWIPEMLEEKHRAIVAKYIPIPRITVSNVGNAEYQFHDFDLNLSEFTHVPMQNDLLRQSLIDMNDREKIHAEPLTFDAQNPEKEIMKLLREESEIDYQKCSALLRKLITTVCEYYREQYGERGLQNIVMMNKKDIEGKIYRQMLQHFSGEDALVELKVIGLNDGNVRPVYDAVTKRFDLYESFGENKIRSVLFTGIQKGVFESAKFDSFPELELARVLERDEDVKNWLRPAPTEFNITYNHGRRYEPDFVVETDDMIYMVEVKGEDKLQDPDVLAKKKRAVQYCAVSSRWGKANGYKEWRYLFIPAKEIQTNSTFERLRHGFCENEKE